MESEKPGTDEPETQRMRFEADSRLQELELAVQRLEVESRLDPKERKSAAPSALSIAIMTGILGLIGAFIGNYFQGRSNLDLEREKSQYQLILKAIETGDQGVAAKNLLFLLRAGLIADPNGKIAALEKSPQDAPVLPSQTAAAPSPEVQIFDNWNGDLVSNKPAEGGKDTQFVLDRPYVITFLANYHWNGGAGAKPRETEGIGLRDSNGNLFGPWQVVATPGTGGTPSGWVCTPNARIPAGTYTVLDPQPGTWSQNEKSGHAGFSRVRGYPADSGKYPR